MSGNIQLKAGDWFLFFFFLQLALIALRQKDNGILTGETLFPVQMFAHQQTSTVLLLLRKFCEFTNSNYIGDEGYGDTAHQTNLMTYHSP